jgi:tagatose-6-phosphate ketose/aldose isomerase
MSGSPLERLASEPEEERKRKGTLHTPGEILKQARLWRETAGRALAAGAKAAALLADADFILLAGAGSSLNAARLMKDAALPRFAGRVSILSCTDLMRNPGAHIAEGRRGLVVSLSRSGESPESVHAARAVDHFFPDVGQAAVTCNPGSRLAAVVGGLANGLCLVLPEECTDRGLATTVSMTSTVLAGRFLLSPEDPAGFLRWSEVLARAAEEFLAREASAAEATAARNPDRVVFLGTGPGEAAAEEAAHKVLEMTDGQVVTMARSYLEFRHGPIAFLNPRTTVVCFLSAAPRVDPYELDFLRQLRGWGAAMEVVAVSPWGDVREASGVVDRLSAVRGLEICPPGEGALLSLLFGQMLGLFLSVRRGLAPDRPGTRGLVNPVVEGVRIYDEDFGLSREA